MSEIEIVQDDDVLVIAEDDAASIVVILDSETEIIQTLDQGPPGPPGQGLPGPPGNQGPPGADGNTVLYGAADPTAGQGVNGNFYINTTTHFMFGPKAAGTWPAGTSLVGPQGAQGIQGAQGSQGIPGAQGPQGVAGAPGADGNTVLYGAADPNAGQGVNGNFYINTTTHFMFGPKAAGTWPAGTSLVGPQGAAGNTGPQGPAGAGSPGVAVPIIDGVGAVGVSNNFAREDHVHPSDVNARAVRFDAAQALTAPQQLQARQNIYAAPFDAMAYNGMQYNGAMEVSQERGTSGITGPNQYVCDGWMASWQGTMVPNAAQFAWGIGGFPNILAMGVSTAQASIGAGDLASVQHNIEGYRIAHLQWGTANAQPITIAFCTQHTVAGTYTGAIRNGAANRSYGFTYTQNVANTFEYKTITIPGDTAGTWNVINGVGMIVNFCMACGSTYTVPSANVWSAGNYVAAPGQINAVASTANSMRITGFLVLAGNEAPSAARSPFIVRSFDNELLLCQRYYQKYTTLLFYGYANAAQTAFLSILLPRGMRAAPTITLPNQSLANCGTIVLYSGNDRMVIVQTAVTATGGCSAFFDLICDAR